MRWSIIRRVSPSQSKANVCPASTACPFSTNSGAVQAAADPQVRAAITGLPVAGFSGTLSPGHSVFGSIGGAARGLVRAKTGNLSSVATLAGMVVDRSGRLLIFAFMAPQAASSGGLPVAAATAMDNAASALAGL